MDVIVDIMRSPPEKQSLELVDSKRKSNDISL